MIHALRSGNRLVSAPGRKAYANCEALVLAGLMRQRSCGPMFGGARVYSVTEAGQDALVGRKTDRKEKA